MTRAANEYERADRERDYAKHEPRPSDPAPASSQHEADTLLPIWQQQRAAGVPARERVLPSTDLDFERDLDVVRRCIERT
jgi:hypothetical protein